jgi:hypothetical protein
VRTVIAGLGGAGGTMAFAAFFLPWLSVSCEDMPLVDFSAYDRATGKIAAQQPNETDAYDDALSPHIEYWALLAIPCALITLTGCLALARRSSIRRIGFGLVTVSIFGIALLTIFWLEQRLGLITTSRAPPGAQFKIQNQIGGWISLGGHVLSLVSGLLAVIIGPKWE